ncbi:uncharacterized protein K460DRAFT_408117 [Cucurbitaria berberidis CBS 394.84]|uniref:Uncharacterized protein n=1 Tax=Cucurbitaria berberidis CBS 394.84 TaxID=1168544 RepID=A0A9P4GE40_9PLEO|nr:uncharacterized protein K460DRAFT_408117 [Cucurbitaria berberidis CBS 394.84]KAF1843794.1 hypothetical protein K460DRAFT_408117 [Cucurbitaria berberidis CBS 394.84]
MKFTTIIATILSMAAFTIAAPVANDEVARANHGVCFKSTEGQMEAIPNC